MEASKIYKLHSLKAPSKTKNWNSRLRWEAWTNINNTEAELKKGEVWFLISLAPSIYVNTMNTAAIIFQCGLIPVFQNKKATRSLHDKCETEESHNLFEKKEGKAEEFQWLGMDKSSKQMSGRSRGQNS